MKFQCPNNLMTVVEFDFDIRVIASSAGILQIQRKQRSILTYDNVGKKQCGHENYATQWKTIFRNMAYVSGDACVGRDGLKHRETCP